MRLRKLSPTGDFTFGSSAQNFYVDSPIGVAQAVKTALLLWSGEWFLDTSVGVPYPEGVLGKHSQAQADSVIQQQILSVTGIDSSTLNPTQLVTSIENFSSEIDPQTRKYSSLTATLNTIYGPTELQMENYANF